MATPFGQDSYTIRSLWCSHPKIKVLPRLSKIFFFVITRGYLKLLLAGHFSEQSTSILFLLNLQRYRMSSKVFNSTYMASYRKKNIIIQSLLYITYSYIQSFYFSSFLPVFNSSRIKSIHSILKKSGFSTI